MKLFKMITKILNLQKEYLERLRQAIEQSTIVNRQIAANSKAYKEVITMICQYIIYDLNRPNIHRGQKILLDRAQNTLYKLEQESGERFSFVYDTRRSPC